MTYFESYFKALQSTPVEDITEHTHRTHLENLLNAIAAKQKNKLTILHEPKRISGFGAPDFKVTGTGSIVGYVENKKIEEKLSKIVNSEQIKKYKALNDNILLTNYIEFIWLKGDEKYSESLCTEIDIKTVFNKDKLFINNEQYFYPIRKEVYEFYIGGYQVMDKYLKDRKGRTLSFTEAAHVCNIARVLNFTIAQMNKIDVLTKSWI